MTISSATAEVDSSGAYRDRVRILAVCLGNICRSPAAAAVIRKKAAAAGLDVVVDSAGTAAYHVGEPPHPSSVAAGARRGYDVTGRARRLGTSDFSDFDLIVTMDEANLADVRRSAPAGSTARIAPLRSFEPGAGDLVVPDPWGEGDEAYERMYDLIEAAVAGLVDSLGNAALPPAGGTDP